jgi:tetratricopeptide (TPR) repeat protein
MNAADGCNTCLTYHLAVAQQAAGDEDEALATLEAYLRSGGAFALWHDRQTLGPSFLMAAEIYESRGDNDRAIENYTRLIDLWKNADPEFQPFVDQARGRLDFLIGRQVQEPSS